MLAQLRRESRLALVEIGTRDTQKKTPALMVPRFAAVDMRHVDR